MSSLQVLLEGSVDTKGLMSFKSMGYNCLRMEEMAPMVNADWVVLMEDWETSVFRARANAQLGILPIQNYCSPGTPEMCYISGGT